MVKQHFFQQMLDSVEEIELVTQSHIADFLKHN